MSSLSTHKMQRPGYNPSSRRAPQNIQGNLALKAREQLKSAAQWRPSIEVVSTRAQRKARPKVFYAFITLATLMGIIIAQLLLSVALASGAYEIASLKQSNKELARTYQTVNQDLDRLSSPQNLSANAEALGMVTNSTPVYLRLSDGAVLGSPEPASPNGAVLNGAEGAVPNSLLSGVTLVTQKESEAKAAAAKKAAEEAMKKAPDSAPAAAIQVGPVALTNGLPGVATH